MLDPSYDAVGYDPSDAVVVPADAIIDAGRRFGFAPTEGFKDGLDLGCGTGKGLLALGESLRGRIVGVDVSKNACALAIQRAPAAEVICADLQALTADRLGGFDLITCVGVLYILPEAVLAHTLSLIRDCLRPGGLALLSYYAGPLHVARATFNQWVQSQVPRELAPADAVARARILIAAKELEAANRADPIGTRLREICAFSAQGSDALIFHEVLNPHFYPLSTAHLARPPLTFLDDLSAPLLSTARGEERTLLAALGEAGGGLYRRSVFVRV